MAFAASLMAGSVPQPRSGLMSERPIPDVAKSGADLAGDPVDPVDSVDAVDPVDPVDPVDKAVLSSLRTGFFGAARPSHQLTRFVFFRALGLVYTVAFAILVNQMIPLFGSGGLM